MTGYGRGQGENGGYQVFAEVRAVNHRFLDLKIRGGSLSPAIEELVSKKIREEIHRGALGITIRVTGAGVAPKMRVDQTVAKQIHNELSQLAQSLQIKKEVPLSLVCQQPGVLVYEESRTTDTSIEPDLEKSITEAISQAIDAVMVMRGKEGAALRGDLQKRFKTVAEIAETLQSIAKDAPAAWHKRLSERLEKITSRMGTEIDEARVAQEVAVLADRIDITEELVRIESHLGQCNTLLKQDGPVGRRLDFLMQELGREFNTVGSKSQTAEIAKAIVDAKACLEKIREQVQNIE